MVEKRSPLGSQEQVINQPILIDQSASTSLQPRAIGTAALSVRADEAGVTRIKKLRQSGSMKLVFPTTHAKHAEAIMVNTAGGITGGDRFDVTAHVGANASLTLTTQAAERVYRAQPGEVGRVTTALTVDRDARLNWLPQELILFDNCALRRRLRVELGATARLLMVEPMVFGRTAMKEELRKVFLRDRISISREGLPVYLDGMDLSGDAAAHLARPCIANAAGAMASLVYIAPEAEGVLGRIRKMLPASAGASMIAKDVLVLRLLAPCSFEMRRSLVPILDLLTQNTLPKSWRL